MNTDTNACVKNSDYVVFKLGMFAQLRVSISLKCQRKISIKQKISTLRLGIHNKVQLYSFNISQKGIFLKEFWKSFKDLRNSGTL